MNRLGKNEGQTIFGIAIFLTILVIFTAQGVFSAILDAFVSPVFGFFGPILGLLFVLIIILALAQRIFEK